MWRLITLGPFDPVTAEFGADVDVVRDGYSFLASRIRSRASDVLFRR